MMEAARHDHRHDLRVTAEDDILVHIMTLTVKLTEMLMLRR